MSDDRQRTQLIITTPDNKRYDLQPTQGKLTRTFTYDVQNLKEKAVTGIIPQELFNPRSKYFFLFAGEGSNDIKKILSHKSDRLEIIYQNDTPGWLIFHFAYDPKWQITVDQKIIKYYRANKSFIGFPVSQGEHHIEISYWPKSWLRLSLLISAILANISILVLICLCFKTIRWKSIAQDTNLGN